MAQQASALFGMTRNPIPHGAVGGALQMRDGLTVRYARWEASAAQRLGTVCLFGGLGEFIEKYFETVTDLRRRGFAVATLDWRGQGGSTRLLSNRAKIHAVNFAAYDDDIRRFMTQIVLPDCPPPYYCLAHSMGGHLALRLAQTKLCWWDRIVLSAPMIRFSGSQNGIGVRCAMSQALRMFGFGRAFVPGGTAKIPEDGVFETNALTSDCQRFERSQEILKAAPHLGTSSPTIGWAAAACDSINRINSPEFMQSVKVPILIVAAGNDQIVSTDAIEQFASQLKTCKRIVIAGARHEILQERDEFREQFWAAFDAYVPGSSLSKMVSSAHA